jgi:Glycosyl transferases group 1
MAQSVERCYLALIGDGPMGSKLAALHGAASRLYCVPGFLQHDALPAVYASADAHATCSMFETLGNTVLEAHACGTPVVVPRTQGFVDTVSHGVDGFLFDGSRLEDGAAALRTLRDSPELRAKFGAAGRAKVQENSPARVADDIVDWYGTSSKRLLKEGALCSAVRTSQLIGAVALVLAAWNLYSVPAALLKALQQAFRQARCTLASTSVVRTITSGYATTLAMVWDDRQPPALKKR